MDPEDFEEMPTSLADELALPEDEWITAMLSPSRGFDSAPVDW